MKKIHFIINPISGKGTNPITKDIVHSVFSEKEYDIQLFFTAYKYHATELAKQSVLDQAEIVVASGGDSTINEVASCLVGTDVILGIVPAGSGNGLASNLNIPKEVIKALEIIKRESLSNIDVGRINDHYFFSNSGMGFDAQVIKNYEASNQRTITSYLKSSYKALRELQQKTNYCVTVDDKETMCTPFMIFVSNSNELGYNLSLTPKASLMDGVLDVLVVSKISKLRVLLFGGLMLFKSHHILKEVQLLSAKKIFIEGNENGIEFQLDGEVKKTEGNTLSYEVLESALRVIS